MNRKRWWTILLTCLSLQAQAAYISDSTKVSLLPEPKPGLKSLAELPSGAPIRILQQQSGWTQVERPNGEQGWVQSKWVTEQLPASLQLLELQAKHRQLQSQHQASQKQIADLEKRLAVLAPKTNQSESDAPPQQNHEPGTLPWSIWSGLLILLFSGGVLLGRFWEDRKQRQRHHGFRV